MNDLFGFTPTNTFDTATFDVLKMDAVEDPLIDVNKLATMDLEECYFDTTVKFIIESNKEFAESKIKLYHNISEATSYGVIHESFSDFFDKVKEIIDKFLKFLKSLFQRFLSSLAKMINSEEYLKKHKKDFEKFSPADKFEFDGYEYTFSETVPDPDAIIGFTKEFLGDIGGNEYNDLDITSDSIKAVLDILKPNLEDKYCAYRARVLGLDETKKIYSTDYSDELFKIFRNDESTTDTIEADTLYIRKAVERFFNHKKIESDTNKQYKKVEKSYKEVEKLVKDITKNTDLTSKAIIGRLPSDYASTKVGGSNDDNVLGVKMAPEILNSLDEYVKVKTEEVQECSNIHALAFSAKLDAIKECAKQDKNTLYLAIARIQRTNSKRERDENKI